MLSKKRSRLAGHTTALIAAVVCVAAAFLLFINRQGVVDQLSVWQYQPSSAVASFVERSGMSESGKFYFYASQPSVETAAEFNKKCGREEERTAILGCYNGRNIYIYNVTDQRIDGIREVTAAHEMLHAAYDRLNEEEIKKLDALLEAEHAKLKTDKKLAERIAFYERTEPGQRNNELHSMIGTEVASISPELESYYKKYFIDRSKVVALHVAYASVFNDLQSRSQEITSQLTELNKSIEQASQRYNGAVSQLNKDINSFNERADRGEFSDNNEFQTERTRLIARADQLDADRRAIDEDVTRFETLRQELAGIASQSEALNQSIDSSLAPAPSL